MYDMHSGQRYAELQMLVVCTVRSLIKHAHKNSILKCKWKMCLSNHFFALFVGKPELIKALMVYIKCVHDVWCGYFINQN